MSVYIRRMEGVSSYTGAVGNDRFGTVLQEALREKILQAAAMGPKLAVATRGSRGCLAWDGTWFYTGGIVSCPVVDTRGAGDSFIAGFLMAWLEGKPVPACMQLGAEQAAVTIGCAGGW